MYSQCPDCLARFRVTAAQLRAARGTVRCGRCGGAFDALSRLSDSLPRTEPVAAAALLGDDQDELAAAAQSGVPPEYHFSAADLEKVFIEARDWSPTATSAPVFDSDDDQPEELIVDEPDQVEDITLEGERIRLEGGEADSFSMLPDDDDTGTPLDFDLTGDVEILPDDTTNRSRALRDVEDLPEAAASFEQVAASARSTPTAATTAPIASSDVPAPPVPLTPSASAATSSPATAARDWPLPPPSRLDPPGASAAAMSAGERWSLSTPADDLTDLGTDDVRDRRRALTWRVGSIVLASLLTVQLVHHYRDRLVRQPGIGSAIRALYEGLGVPIGDAWDLNAYELRQWGAGSDLASGRLNVRASVTNRAAFAQPLPLLRVEIEDRFGAAVAIRDFQPGDYLKNPARAGRLLGTGEAADAELDVVTTGVDGVGYRLNVCMRDADGSVHCASAPG
jgi:predicted Zn finger-like uncharacterized protein